jgi:hypothetical protein
MAVFSKQSIAELEFSILELNSSTETISFEFESVISTSERIRREIEELGERKRRESEIERKIFEGSKEVKSTPYKNSIQTKKLELEKILETKSEEWTTKSLELTRSKQQLQKLSQKNQEILDQESNQIINNSFMNLRMEKIVKLGGLPENIESFMPLNTLSWCINQLTTKTEELKTISEKRLKAFGMTIEEFNEIK